jgi:hypothetical protein
VELLITVGRDSRVAYQNGASAKLEPLSLGESIVKRTFVLSLEDVRDAIFGGRTISYSGRLLHHQGKEFLLTREYRPLLGEDGEITGVISMGWSRKAPSAEDYSDLSAIVCALESPELPNQLSAARPLPASSRGELSGSQALAQRLRRFLPQRLQ